MKIRYKICLILIVVQLVFTLFYNTHVSALYASLEEFVQKNGMESMSNDEINAKTTEALDKITDENQKFIVSNKVADIIGSINGEYDSDEERMKKFNEAFITNQGDAYGDEALSDLYFGYMLGQEWITHKKASEEQKESTSNGKSIAQQFDDKYNEYKKLSDNKKDLKTLQEYYNSLNSLYKQLSKKEKTNERTERLDEVYTAYMDKDSNVGETPDAIFQYPSRDDSTGSAAGSLDDMIGDADKFLDKSSETAISAESLQNFSKTFYNILLTVGIIVAVLVGSILGIKFMIGGAEGKANVKELILPYIVGCIVIFGAFAIWKLAVTLLSGM